MTFLPPHEARFDADDNPVHDTDARTRTPRYALHGSGIHPSLSGHGHESQTIDTSHCSVRIGPCRDRGATMRQSTRPKPNQDGHRLWPQDARCHGKRRILPFKDRPPSRKHKGDAQLLASALSLSHLHSQLLERLSTTSITTLSSLGRSWPPSGDGRPRNAGRFRRQHLVLRRRSHIDLAAACRGLLPPLSPPRDASSRLQLRRGVRRPEDGCMQKKILTYPTGGQPSTFGTTGKPRPSRRP
ncbi:uncharacterized protein B0H18DRAFT_670219 [Fomitopsis serialis]|uniref:uncharacterized protein n=1 Tax=Fomitopsis serialis TaxID=139415 RepID=UPI00200895C8|nr:uncharacterized protein B0H18DRAFT_670219 [Neoantrodia serialis]KAH9932871.1 hypothetical protein B0H18DRAFT_670219 [Neoantrodia serialis]